MINKTADSQEQLTKERAVQLIACVGLAVFWVIFFWNFWTKGIYALGINAFIFIVLLLGLFVWILFKKGKYDKSDQLWILPLYLIALSFLLYDIPFVKVITLLVLPVTFIIFYNYAFLDDKKEKPWDVPFAFRLLERFLGIINNLGKSLILYLEFIIPANKKYKKIIAKVILGLLLFFIIAFTIFIPLLSSADSQFKEAVKVIYDWFTELISLPFMYKLFFAIALSITLFSAIITWGKKFTYTAKDSLVSSVDSIITGIVLGGILLLYLLFLLIQLTHLWVGLLPFDFKETESLVKSGFWQLFVLTLLNILIYFFTYKKTSKFVQKILLAFTVASLLLLVSAAHRMALYVIYYGFSYEKFFASYTVLFCALLFFWLISRLAIHKKANIIKFTTFLFIWMYGIMTVFPIEQFILRSNVALAQHENSRIRLFELTMLSSDVLGLVKRCEAAGTLKEKVGYLAREGTREAEETFDWGPWIEEQEKRIADKKWYEQNLMNLLYVISQNK